MEHNFSKLRNAYLDDKETEQTGIIIEIFSIRTGKDLKQLYLQSDVFF